jgi:hypothetical protein
VSNCQEYSLKWINKTAGFVKCFYSGIFAESNIFYARHFNFCPKTKQNIKLTCVAVTKYPGFVNYKKGAFDSQSQVIKFNSCLPMVGGSLRLPPPLKLVVMIVAEILLKVVFKHQKSKSCYTILAFYLSKSLLYLM